MKRNAERIIERLAFALAGVAFVITLVSELRQLPSDMSREMWWFTFLFPAFPAVLVWLLVRLILWVVQARVNWALRVGLWLAWTAGWLAYFSRVVWDPGWGAHYGPKAEYQYYFPPDFESIFAGLALLFLGFWVIARLTRPRIAKKRDDRAIAAVEDAQAAYANGDYDTAARLWRPLAEQGDSTAQRSLGAMHADGRGVPQDYQEALMWFRDAAEQGLTDAQADLGLMYASGQGTPQDYVEAYKWLNLAAATYQAGEARDRAVAHRDRIAALMTPEQLAEGQRRARKWKPKIPWRRHVQMTP